MQLVKGRVIARQEVLRTIAKSISRYALTSVTAPAGYGKTTIAQKLLGHNHRNRFFHSVPGNCDDNAYWWDTLFASLAKQGLEDADELRRLGFPQNESASAHSIAIIKKISPPFTLILDDCQNFVGKEIDKFLETMILARPGDHRIVLFSRNKPAMNLDLLVDMNLAAVFDQKLLEFSKLESMRFFFLNGIGDKKIAEQAWTYSEGWPIAVWLCLQSQRNTGEMPSAINTDSLIERAVFSTYSREEQDFLMRLSALESFTVSEAEALIAGTDTAGRLFRMSEGNALVRFDDTTGKYVFHSIFREFLEKKRALRKDLNSPELYRRAAECHVLRGDFFTAYRLLAKAGRDEDLIRVLEVLLLNNDEKKRGVSLETVRTFGVIRSIIEKIPWRLRLKRPLGYLMFIWYCFEDSFDADVIEMFEDAVARFAKSRDIPQYMKRRLEGEAEFMRGWLYYFSDMWETPKRYRKACEVLDGPSFFRYDRMCWNFCCPSLLFIYVQPGKSLRDEYFPFLECISPLLQRLTDGVIEGIRQAAHVEERLECGRFDEAALLLDDTELTLNDRENITYAILTRFARSRLKSALGSPEDGLSLLVDMLPEVEATNSKEYQQSLELAIGYLCFNAGRPETAPKWLQNCEIFCQPYADSAIQCFMVAVCGRLYLARGDFDGLEAFLSGTPDIFGPVELVFSGMHASVFQAIIAWRRGDEKNAVERLREAVELSRPDGLVLSIAEYGRFILPILRQLSDRTRKDAHLESLLALTERIGGIQDWQDKKNLCILSPRECEVMHLVVKGKSTAAIARKIGVIQQTVKKHLASAYKKLSAKNRAQAAFRFQAEYIGKSGNGPADEAFDETPSSMRSAKSALRENALSDDGAGYFMRLVGEGVTSQFPEYLMYSDPERHRMIGETLVERGELANAFYFFLRAGREEDQARALELFTLPGAPKLMSYCFDELCSAVGALSWDVRRSRAAGYIAFLWWMFRTSSGYPSGLLLDEALHHLSRAALPGRRAEGEIELLRGVLHASDTAALWDCQARALQLLEGPTDLYSPFMSWTFGNPHCSFAMVRAAGDFAELDKRVVAAAGVLARLSGGRCCSLAVAFRMERHLERGELEKAAGYIPELEEQGEDDMQTAIIAAFAGARLLCAKGEGGEAVDRLERLWPEVERLDSWELSESLSLALGYVKALTGTADGIAEWLRSGRVGWGPHGAAARRPFALAAYGKTLATAGEFRLLDSVARNLPARFRQYDTILGRIHGKVLEAIAARHLRGDDEAMGHLQDALELAEADGLVFPIAEYGGLVLSMLRRLSRDMAGRNHVELATTLADRIYRRAGTGARTRSKEPSLTRREREIMRLVIQGMSNTATANALGISESSIQKTLSSVYGKLGVANRAEASRVFNQKFAEE